MLKFFVTDLLLGGFLFIAGKAHFTANGLPNMKAGLLTQGS